MSRYWRLFWVQLRASLQVAMQYRVDFLVGSAMGLFWLAANLAPMWVVWGRRGTVAGWQFPEAVLVVAWFTLLKSLLEGAVQPSLVAVVEHIRKGTLDFVLLKPADAQFLVSTARFEPWSLMQAVAAVVMMVWSLRTLALKPSLAQLGAAAALTVASALLLYALAILVVAAAFWVVRLDNLIYLFNSIFDVGRWPQAVFRGLWRVVFTFVIPIALMTTYPAEALLGRLDGRTLALALVGAVVFAAASRLVWLRAIGHYTSASS
jgi:viologen exporter family transport system permease protein